MSITARPKDQVQVININLTNPTDVLVMLNKDSTLLMLGTKKTKHTNLSSLIAVFSFLLNNYNFLSVARFLWNNLNAAEHSVASLFFINVQS